MTTDTAGASEQLMWALKRLAQMQGTTLDPLRAIPVIGNLKRDLQRLVAVKLLCKSLQLRAPKYLEHPDRARLPLLVLLPDKSWGVVVNQLPNGLWVVEVAGTSQLCNTTMLANCTIQADLTPRGDKLAQTFGHLLTYNLGMFRAVIWEASLASLLIGGLALATSLFSMQVYDRVIPTRNDYTLAILSIGVLLGIVLELALKFARSAIMDRVVTALDARLSREVFYRLLSVRLDHLPGSVGSLASQMRGYEQVRAFYTASTMFSLVDMPVGLALLVLMGFIGSPVIALVPLVFGVLSVVMGLFARNRINELVKQGATHTNQRTGLLVEAIEGAETIKAGSGGWKFLSRWLNVNAKALENDQRTKHISEGISHVATAMQQVAYAGIIVAGAVVVMQGGMTTGALIACSILGGRVMAPFLALPMLITQKAQADAAVQNLEQLFKLKTDDHGPDRKLVPQKLLGNFHLEGVSFAYPGGNKAITVDKLDISAGERVGILGPIGAGKSTLLRMLAGLYAPQEGRVMIDGMDMDLISRQVISQHMGYLQQDHRLFQGSLRDNLLIGTTDPGDDVIFNAMRRTGLAKLVATHPKGLELPIAEGGKGLSGGQRQLVAFTRLLLSGPSVYLLDEPTASMDDMQERQCLTELNQEILEKHKTLVLVTHKMSTLGLVNRLIVVLGNRVVLDGPRDLVLEKLRGNNVQLNAQKAQSPSQSPPPLAAASPAKPSVAPT